MYAQMFTIQAQIHTLIFYSFLNLINQTPTLQMLQNFFVN